MENVTRYLASGGSLSQVKYLSLDSGLLGYSIIQDAEGFIRIVSSSTLFMSEAAASLSQIQQETLWDTAIELHPSNILQDFN
jgi:hypothetical protein